MRVVIDMQGAQTSFSRNRGVGRYTIELVKSMVLNSTEHEIILALNGYFLNTIEDIRSEFYNILPQENIRVWQQFFDTTAIKPENKWRKNAGEILREEFLNSLHGDIIFSTNLQEGIFDAACTSVKRIPTESIVCSTLHDVVPLSYPNEYLGDDKIRAWYEEKLNYAAKSDIIITVSNSSKLDISNGLQIPPEKIHVIYNAVNHSIFEPICIGSDEKKRFLSKMNISSPFVMYVGGTDLHKNLDALYSAFSQLPKYLLNSYELVMVGENFKREERALHKKFKKLGIDDKVIFTGQVGNKELAMLYNLCDLFVFPSTNEGFGLPPLEAMASGAAVLASNTSSLPEIVGYQDALFDPHDISGLAKRMESVLTDRNFKNLLKNHGIEQAMKFKWENSARSLLNLFDEFVGKREKIESLSIRNDPIENIINYIINISLSFTDNDLKMLSASVAESFYPRSYRKMFLDVSSIITLNHLSGIQRVDLAICNELINNRQKIDIDLVYTTADDSEFYRATTLMKKISIVEVTSDRDEWIEFCPGDILFFLDLHPAVAISHKEKIKYLRNKGIFVYHMVYDLLPALMPEFFWPELCVEFNEWLHSISYSDGAICISRSVADDLSYWLNSHAPIRLRPFKIGWIHLGADIKNAVPTCGLPNDAIKLLSKLAKHPSFLMVGTVEPRKGYDQTLTAFEQLWEDGLYANLVIVGREGWMNEKFLERLKNHPECNKRFFWLRGISDEYLDEVYGACTCLIASSEGEGFGLPLIEAAQHKLPIIARNIPVFHEVAGDHAFYFEGKKPSDLAKAVQDWLELYSSDLYPKSENIPCITWKQSAHQMLDIILNDNWFAEFKPQKAKQ